MNQKEKERIEEAAKAHLRKQYKGDYVNERHELFLKGDADWPSDWEKIKKDFRKGAEYERPIAYNQGWNDAVNEILARIDPRYDLNGYELLHKFNALKKEI